MSNSHSTRLAMSISCTSHPVSCHGAKRRSEFRRDQGQAQHTAVEQVRRAARVGLWLWSDIPALLLDAAHSQGSVEEEEESGVN